MNHEVEKVNQDQASMATGHRLTEEEARRLADSALQWADHTAEEMFNANEINEETV
jgi:hypothetical protein